MEHKAYFKNKAGNNAVTTHSDMKKNIPFSFAITVLHCTHSIKKRAEQNWLSISSTWNWEENKSFIIYGWWKLLGRNENDLDNEMKIVQTISKDINKKFGLEICARICLKRGSVQSKMHVGSIFENDIKELDPRIAHMYLGIEECFDIQHKH